MPKLILPVMFVINIIRAIHTVRTQEKHDFWIPSPLNTGYTRRGTHTLFSCVRAVTPLFRDGIQCIATIKVA